jgi:hypothetical protein
MRGLDAVGILLQLHGVSPNLFGVALDDIRVVETRIDSGPPARIVCRALLSLSANRTSRERRARTKTLCPRWNRSKTTGDGADATPQSCRLWYGKLLAARERQRMHRRWVEAALLVSLGTTIPALAILGVAMGGRASAQQVIRLAQQPSIMQDDSGVAAPPASSSRPRGRKPPPAFEHDPDLDAQDQFSPSQVEQPLPDAVQMPGGAVRGRARGAVPSSNSAVEPGAAGAPAHAGKSNIVACSGIFAKDSSHAKLTSAFRSHNVSYAQVETNSGGKAMASVLYPKDPKRRLEVWWSQPATKSDTHLIVINGQSDWIAPGEVHLGLTLADLEKLNGKPFKLSGFDKDQVATLSDWDGGTLSAPAGGCKIGISLRADPKAPAATLAGLRADRAYASSDASLRAANPTVSEILVAY